MRSIYKYPININKPEPIELHEGAEVVHFDRDGNGKICIWCLVDTEKPLEEKTFVIKGTGFSIESNLWYIKSFKDTAGLTTFFWHLFEKLN